MPSRDASRIEEGVLTICGVEYPAERWIDSDGAYFVRSREFDIYGQGDNWAEAYQSFFYTADDLLNHLVALLSNEEATPYERDTVRELGPRVVATLSPRWPTQAYPPLPQLLDLAIEHLGPPLVPMSSPLSRYSLNRNAMVLLHSGAGRTAVEEV